MGAWWQSSTVRQSLEPFKGALEAFIDDKDRCTSHRRIMTRYLFGGREPSLCCPQRRAMYFSESVIKSHCSYVDFSIGLNSQLTFIIRLLQGIIENSFVGDKSLNIELMCGLVSLLTHQYIVCREEKDFTPASLSKKLKSIAEKSVEDTDVPRGPADVARARHREVHESVR